MQFNYGKPRKSYFWYQIKLAPSYVQDKIKRKNNEVFEIEMLRHDNSLHQPGFIRLRLSILKIQKSCLTSVMDSLCINIRRGRRNRRNSHTRILLYLQIGFSYFKNLYSCQQCTLVPWIYEVPTEYSLFIDEFNRKF